MQGQQNHQTHSCEVTPEDYAEFLMFNEFKKVKAIVLGRQKTLIKQSKESKENIDQQNSQKVLDPELSTDKKPSKKKRGGKGRKKANENNIKLDELKPSDQIKSDMKAPQLANASSSAKAKQKTSNAHPKIFSCGLQALKSSVSSQGLPTKKNAKQVVKRKLYNSRTEALENKKWNNRKEEVTEDLAPIFPLTKSAFPSNVDSSQKQDDSICSPLKSSKAKVKDFKVSRIEMDDESQNPSHESENFINEKPALKNQAISCDTEHQTLDRVAITKFKSGQFFVFACLHGHTSHEQNVGNPSSKKSVSDGSEANVSYNETNLGDSQCDDEARVDVKNSELVQDEEINRANPTNDQLKIRNREDEGEQAEDMPDPLFEAIKEALEEEDEEWKTVSNKQSAYDEVGCHVDNQSEQENCVNVKESKEHAVDAVEVAGESNRELVHLIQIDDPESKTQADQIKQEEIIEIGVRTNVNLMCISKSATKDSEVYGLQKVSSWKTIAVIDCGDSSNHLGLQAGQIQTVDSFKRAGCSLRGSNQSAGGDLKAFRSQVEHKSIFRICNGDESCCKSWELQQEKAAGTFYELAGSSMENSNSAKDYSEVEVPKRQDDPENKRIVRFDSGSQMIETEAVKIDGTLADSSLVESSEPTKIDGQQHTTTKNSNTSEEPEKPANKSALKETQKPISASTKGGSE